jgi:predicted PP-loop superfamily ATPase
MSLLAGFLSVLFHALVSPAVARSVRQHQIENISFGDLLAKPFS